MIRKVYEVNPLTCPRCRGEMRIIAFLTDYVVVDRIIDHIKLRFVADKPPPSDAFEQIALNNFLILDFAPSAGLYFF